MRINKQKINGHKGAVALAVAAVILVISLGYVGYAWQFSLFPFGSNQPVDNPNNTVDLESPTQPQQEAGTRTKHDFIQRHEREDGQSDSLDSNGGAMAKPVSLVITSSNQGQAVYHLRAMIDIVDEGGTCTLTMQSDKSVVYERSAGTQNLGSYSVCEGFDIQTDGLEKGVWTVVIEYRGSAGQVASAQKRIEVK